MLTRIFKTAIGLGTIKSCGTGTATLLGFDSQPAAPVPGDNVTLWVAYTLPEPVTAGNAIYTVTLNGIPFSPTVDELCTQTACPKEANVVYNETSSSIFPSGVSGKIVSQIEWTDQNDNTLWCVETSWRVSD